MPSALARLGGARTRWTVLRKVSFDPISGLRSIVKYQVQSERLQRCKKSAAFTTTEPSTGVALCACSTSSSPNCRSTYPELSGFVGVLHFQPTHRVLEEERDATEVGMCLNTGDLLVSELFDWYTTMYWDDRC